MSRYRRYKPTRAEVAAAMEVYKPYMKPGDDVFKPGICWSVIQGIKHESNDHLCGGPANKYMVTHGSVKNCSPHAIMWVCLTHKARMEKKGYEFLPA